MKQFEQFEATSLFCARCQKAVPIRKKLLLVLPDGSLFDYLCAHCSSSVGTKKEPLTEEPAPRTVSQEEYGAMRDAFQGGFPKK
jgi:hypothetical protein